MANELTYQSVFTGQQMDERFTAVAQLQAALLEVETALSAKYVKPASGIPETDLDSAVQSALAKARSAVQDLSNYYTKTEIDSLLAAVNSQEYVDVTTLPTASASTLGKIYLVGPTNNQYDRYYTSYDGSAYSWVAAGSTEINLSNYATKAELNQLDQKVTVTDVLNLTFTADRGLRPSGSQGKIISGYSSDYSYYAPVINGQVINLRFTFSSGYIRYAYTQVTPAIGVACTGYTSYGTSYSELNLTAPYDGYILLDFDVQPTTLTGTSPAGNTIGHDVFNLKKSDAANSKVILANFSAAPVYESGNGWVNKSNGQLVTVTPYNYTYKKVTYDSKYVYLVKSATISGDAAAMLNFYGTNDAFLGYAYAPGTSTSYTDVIVDAPTGTQYIIFVSEVAEGVMQYSNFMTDEPYWKNKRILWLGTSIPATAYDGGLSYPAIVCNNLGALLTNNALSGSFARKKFNPADLADMHDLDMQWDMLSLVTSFADITDLTTNWANYKACFTDAPDTLTEEYVNMYQGASYETLLDPYIQDSDLIVFDHGRNDLPDMINADDMFDKFTFVGAMNWLIKHIYEAKPRARVCVISHYENQRYPTIVTNQEVVADYWSIPIFRLDKMLGWSNRQITTNYAWNGNVFEPSTSHTMSVQHAWLKDDLHPYLDSTGESTKLIAQAITEWMKTIV